MMPSVYDIHDDSFLSVPMTQSWYDLWLWECFLNVHNPKSIIELGTGRGGMSLFLSIQATQRGKAFVTCDINEPACLFSTLPDAVSLRGRFVKIDIFGDGYSRIAYWLKSAFDKPLVLFCDNGDKRKEVALFVPFLSPGDFLAVHDFGTEFTSTDAAGYPCLRLIHGDDARSMTRWWVKT